MHFKCSFFCISKHLVQLKIHYDVILCDYDLIRRIDKMCCNLKVQNFKSISNFFPLQSKKFKHFGENFMICNFGSFQADRQNISFDP